MAKKTRKCSICKKEFDISKTEYLKTNVFTEKECFIQKQLSRGLSMDIINAKINVITEAMRADEKAKMNKEVEKEKKKLNAKLKEADRDKNKNEFVDYIKDIYNLTTIPKYTYIKLAEINNGTYKDLSEGISYEDLLYIFKRKQKYFDKVFLKNNSNGKEMKGVSRLNYDLAIAINLYDEYKDWKRKQQILQSDIINEQKKENENNINEIDYSKIKTKVNNETDISDILGDLY